MDVRKLTNFELKNKLAN